MPNPKYIIEPEVAAAWVAVGLQVEARCSCSPTWTHLQKMWEHPKQRERYPIEHFIRFRIKG